MALTSAHNDDKRLLGQLTMARNYLLGRALGEAGMWCLLVLALSALVMLAAELGLYLPAAWRITVLTAVLTAVLGIAIWRGSVTLARYGRLGRVARAIEQAHPELRNRLSSSLEFAAMDQARFGESFELMRAAVRQALSLVDSREKVAALADTVLRAERRRLRLAMRLTAVAAGIFMLLGALNPLTVHRALDNYSHPLRLLAMERSYRILVQPGDKTLLRGDSLAVRAMGTVPLPGEMTLEVRQAGQPAERLTMDYDPAQFEHTLSLDNLQNDFEYNITHGDATSDTFKVTVTNNPFVTELSLSYEYPSYTGLENFITTREKAIQGLRGSRVTISGRASNPLDSAWIRLDSDSTRPAVVFDTRSFSNTLYLEKGGSYSILLRDTWGLTGSDTLVYPVTVLPDERPAVALRHPKGQADLNEEMIQPLVYELADDFGLRSLVLNWRRIKSSGDEGQQQSEVIASWRGQRPTHILEQYNWNMGGIGLLPEDEVAYSLTVYDNDTVSGPKSSSTAEFRIRFPSLEEIFNREQNRQEQITTDLKELEDKGQDLHEQVKQLNETLERGEQLQWEDNQQLNQALQEQKKMLEEVRDLAGQLEESLEQMQRGEMMSSELVEKMARVQELMNEVATDKLKKLMQQVQQSIERMDQNALEEAMKKLQVSQEEILQKLDKTLALLEKIQLEQQLDRLVQQTEMLAEAAAAMADSTAPMLDSEQLAQADSILASQEDPWAARRDSAAGGETSPAGDSPEQQEAQEAQAQQQSQGESQPGNQQQSGQEQDQGKLAEMAGNTGDMQQQAQDLFSKIDEAVQQFGAAGEMETTANLMSEAMPSRQEPIKKSLEQAQDGYQQGHPQQGYQGQRSAQRELNQMKERMQKYRDEMREQWQSEVAEAMKRAFDELSFLSENQEEVLGGVNREPDFNHPDILTYAAREQEIVQGIEAVRKDMVAAAKDNFFISNQLLSILYMATSQSEDSAEKLAAENRRKDQAVPSLQRSLTALNAGMLTLLDDSEQMQRSGSGTGLDMMMQQMEEMARRQQQLNQQSQDALNQQQQQGQGQNSMPMPGGTTQQQGQSGEGMMQMLARMAAEQEAIRQQLQQMAEQMSGRQDLMGDALEGAAKEAGEVVKELQERGLSRETLERQNRIFNRMLDAQRSIQERENGRQRKAERPEDFTVTPPSALPDGLLEGGDQNDELRRTLERWQGSYPESYQDLIREYYELLRTRELEQN